VEIFLQSIAVGIASIEVLLGLIAIISFRNLNNE
jgi:hypothetical protein